MTPGLSLRRNAWNLADQTISVLSNLLVALFVAHESSQRGFGSFALAMSIYILTVLLSRAVCGQTMLISMARMRDVDESRMMASAFLGLGAVIGAGGACACLVTALFAHGALRQDSLTLAAFMIPLVVQDVARFVFFARGEPRKAFESDVTWLVVQLLFAWVAVHLSAAPRTVELVMAWGLGGVTGLAFAAYRLRIPVKPIDGLSTLWVNRRLCGQFALELGALNGGTQLLLYVVAGIVGRSEVAGLRGASLLFGPVTLLFTASRSGFLAHAARTAHADPERLGPECRRISLGFGAAMSMLCTTIVFVPTGVGRLLLGPTWAVAQPLLPAFAVQFVILAFAEGAGIGLRALAASRQLARVALRYAGLSLTLGVIGAYLYGVRGAAWGNGVSAFLILLEYNVYLRRRFTSRASAAALDAGAARPLDIE